MPGSTFGHLFRITTFGESHGGAVGVVVDGATPGVDLCEADIQTEPLRRRPGTSSGLVYPGLPPPPPVGSPAWTMKLAITRWKVVLS